MQFCRIYTGADSKSHFEDFDQNQGAKHFLTGLDVKTLVFKNDTNREDLHGWHNAPRRQWCITLSGTVEIGIGDGSARTFGAAMSFLPRISPAKAIPRCRKTGSERLFTCNRKWRSKIRCVNASHRAFMPVKTDIQLSLKVLDSGSPPAFAGVARNDDLILAQTSVPWQRDGYC